MVNDLIDLMRDAATAERARYVVEREYGNEWTVQEIASREVVRSDTREACAAHLERLVQIAVLRALQEAGYAIAARGVVSCRDDLLERVLNRIEAQP